MASNYSIEYGSEGKVEGVAADVVRDLHFGDADVGVQVAAEVPEWVASGSSAADIEAEAGGWCLHAARGVRLIYVFVPKEPAAQGVNRIPDMMDEV